MPFKWPKIRPCPFCGGKFAWHYRSMTGTRLIGGYVECEGCGCKIGEDLIGLEDGDLSGEIAALANKRFGEKTCKALPVMGMKPEIAPRFCSACLRRPWADAESVTPFCPECGARVVG